MRARLPKPDMRRRPHSIAGINDATPWLPPIVAGDLDPLGEQLLDCDRAFDHGDDRLAFVAVLRAITTACRIRERSVVRPSVTPSTKCSCSGRLRCLRRARRRSRGAAERIFRRCRRRTLLRRLADFERIRPGSDRRCFSEIEPPFDLTIRVPRKDRSRPAWRCARGEWRY